MKKMQLTYGYDDVTLVPAYSDLISRSQANPEMHDFNLPIIASCMDTLNKDVMEKCVSENIPFICHRAFKSAEEQFLHFFPNYEKNNPELVNKCVWFAVGSMQKYRGWIEELYERFGVRNFCVDMAHGDSKTCIDTIKLIRSFDTCLGNSINKKCNIIAGNVATPEGFKRLQAAGADGIRIGVASGQICFSPDTPVWFMSNSGKLLMKQIRFINVGDKVLTASGKIRKVLKKYINPYKGEVYKIDNDVTTTPTHKFRVYDRIKKEKKLLEIKEFDENIHSFLNVENHTFEAKVDIDEYVGEVYNIEVDDEHTYCVGNKTFTVSNCSTALETGFGVPILTNIIECNKVRKNNTWIIADGGVKTTGDIAKAIWFGADFCMIGKLFASTDLATGKCYNKFQEELVDNKSLPFSLVYPHEFEEKYKLAEKVDWEEHNADNYYKNMCVRNLISYKEYHGMASREARAGVLSYASVEGVQGLVKYSGTTNQFIKDTYLRLQASLSYAGAKNWNEFRKNTYPVMRSNAGIIAADTHLDITLNK